MNAGVEFLLTQAFGNIFILFFSKMSNKGRNKQINSLPALKRIWTDANVKGTNSFQKIVKHNAKSVVEGSLTTSNIITPGGLDLILLSALVQNNVLNIKLRLSENANIDFPAVLYIFLFFKEYHKTVFSMIDKLEIPSPDGYFDLDIKINSNIIIALEEDIHPIVYLAVAGLPSLYKQSYWTSTGSVWL